jgi:hypothetical protein
MDGGIYIPAMLMLSLSIGTVMELSDIAQTSADKAIAYSEDMTAALDCAYTARPLDECSPDLFSTDFKIEADRTRAILEDLEKQQAGANLHN